MGRSDYSLKTLREQFRAQGLFYTPPELAQYIRSLLPDTVHRVYDPTCGRGSLLSVFDDDVEKFGQDIDAAAVEDARASLVNFHGAVGDVLADPAYIDERFDAIVANPPFSIKWHGKADGYLAFAPAVPPVSKADYAFILHILWMLGNHGTAVVLNAPGIGYRGGREAILRQWLIEQNFVDTVVHIPGKTFADTTIATLCLVLKKNRPTTAVHFIDREHQLERTVDRDEIVRENYTLGVGRYVRPPVVATEREYDYVASEMECRAMTLKSIETQIRISKITSVFGGPSVMMFLHDMRRLVDSHINELEDEHEQHV